MAVIGAAAACSGPCDPSVVDYALYAGLVLVALAGVWAAYKVARWSVSKRGVTSRAVPIATIFATATALAILLVGFPRTKFVPSAITVGRKGVETTDPIYLQGSYAVTWRATPTDGSSCHLDAELVEESQPGNVTELVSVNVSGPSQEGESGSLVSLAGARYIVHATTACDWQVRFRPI